MRQTSTAILLASAVALTPHSSAGQSLAITNVTVVPMDRERLLPSHTVLVTDGRITRVGPASQVSVPAGATVIDGSGKFLMPGLAEMHAHIPPGNAPPDVVERVLSLFVLNGVTTVRGMLGDPRHLPLRERVERGDVLGPRIVTSGPSLNGNSVPTVEAGRNAVLEQQRTGYDFLKIHPGIRREVFDTIAATAQRAGIRFAGHVPLDVGLARALEARYATIDHIDGFVEALLKPGASLTSLQSDFFGLNLVGELDDARIPQLARSVKDAGVAIVPTQGFMVAHVGLTPIDSLTARPEMAYWLPNQIKQWADTKRTLEAGPVSREDRERFLDVRRRSIRALRDAGATILLGSDAPQMWDVPGFSIHRELGYMVEAGLTPFEALEAGTRSVAEFLGWSERAGTIAEGKNADLVLVESNPLQDIRNASRIAGVSVRGRWLSRQELDARLAALRIGG